MTPAASTSPTPTTMASVVGARMCDEPMVVFEGYASVFHVRVNNRPPLVIHPGAFAHTIREQWDRVRVLWYHDEGDPVGRPLELREDDYGLFMRAVISPTPRGTQAALMLTRGALTELSVGFDPIQSHLEWSGTEWVQHVTEARLWEVSLCHGAANPKARITRVVRRVVTEREQLDVTERTLAAHALRQRYRDERRIACRRPRALVHPEAL